MEVIWEAPANIALIKYWGKRDQQIPENPSLSFTLSKSTTRTSISISPELNPGSWSFTYQGKAQKSFGSKIQTFFDRVSNDLPFLSQIGLKIDSSNNFPHSSGISSSASFFASLALGLCDLESSFLSKQQKKDDFLRKASSIARRGSGSASRSIYGNIVAWGESQLSDSSNLFAGSVTSDIHPDYYKYRDAILVISSSAKPMSSSSGHELMRNNPYSKTRYQDAINNFNDLLVSLESGDKKTFVEIVEHEAQTLHGLILSSKGGSILMKPNTLKAIELIREYRKESQSHCCFTLDAGPNIHLLYPANEIKEIQHFIDKKLKTLCENGQWIDDCVGEGPIKYL